MSDEYNILQQIYFEFKKLNENIIKFMGFLEAKQPDLEYLSDTRVEEEIIPKSNLKTDTETMGGTIPAPPKKKGKYTWYPLKDGGKVRVCNNEPCPYYLKYNEEIKTYQHGKYDPDSKEWFYMDDNCEFYGGEQ